MGTVWSFTATKNQCNKRANIWCKVNESHDKVASKIMCEALSFMFYFIHRPEIVLAKLESNIEGEIKSTAPGFWKIESSKKDVYPHKMILESSIFAIIFASEQSNKVFFYNFNSDRSEFFYSEIRKNGKKLSFTAIQGRCGKRANLWCIDYESRNDAVRIVEDKTLSFMFRYIHNPENMYGSLVNDISEELESTAPGFW